MHAVISIDTLLAMPLAHAWGTAQAPAAPSPPLADLPPASAGIAAALGPWQEHDGRKWSLCGALGGLMRRYEMSAAACEAVVREWLPAGDPAVDVAAGVKQALGAWRLDAAQVSGVKAVAEVVGDAHAAIIDAACMAAAYPAFSPARAAARAAVAHGVQHAQPRQQYHVPDAPAGGGAVFLITPKGKDVWYYDPRTEGYAECARDSLHVALSTSGASALVETTAGKGKRVAPQALIDNGPTAIVRSVVTDFSRAADAHWDVEGDRILLGVRCPVIAPVHDAAVSAWLSALCGAALPAVHEWIAGTRQDAIHRLATALCLVGPHGAGKTLLAVTCARLWGSTPVSLAHVAAQFNATMARCPVVFDDECATLAKRKISTEDFRVLIQDRARDYEPKGKERRTLLGAQRFILAANDLSALTFSNAVGAGAADAIAERLTVVLVDESARDALGALRDANGEIMFGRLDGHFEWIRQTTPLPGGHVRFLGACAERGVARAAVVAHVLAEHEAVFTRIGAVLLGKAGAACKALFVSGGRLWTRSGPLCDLLATGALTDRWEPRRLRVALAPFRAAGSVVRVDGEPVKAWELDAARLCEALDLDAEIVLRVLSA